MKSTEKLSLSFCSSGGGGGGVLNQLPNTRWMCLLWWRRRVLALDTGDKQSTCTCSAGNECTVNGRSYSSHTHTQLATSDFQTDHMLRWLLLAGTHLRIQGGIMLSYSLPSTLHPQVTYMYICYGPIRNLQPVSKPAGRFRSWPAGFETGRSLYTE